MSVENDPSLVVVDGVRAKRLNSDKVAGNSFNVDCLGGNSGMDADDYPNKRSKNSNEVCEISSEKGLSKEAKKQLKRKRSFVDCDVNSFDMETLIAKCRQELDELFAYYKDVSVLAVPFDDGIACSVNSIVASLIEERTVSFSKLVDEIYGKVVGREGVTLATVRGAVLFVGQRIMYGISSADADVLEDECETCLWCWETRDLKLLPVSVRGTVNIRRKVRKMIHERISALSETLSVLSSSDNPSLQKGNLIKASIKLGKALNKEAISSLVEKLNQKSHANLAEKETKSKEKELVKDTGKNKCSADKEKKKLDHELQKEKLQTEKELKRIQDEHLREEKRREKEELELKKQIKKQQEEAVRKQQRSEKEAARLKKLLAVQKQASIMERFLKGKIGSDKAENLEKASPFKGQSPEKTRNNEVADTATASMDCVFSQHSASSVEDLYRSYLAGWRKMAVRSKSFHWGVRSKPKTVLVKELKLQQSLLNAESTPNKVPSSLLVNKYGEPSNDKLDDEFKSVPFKNHRADSPTSVHLLKKKLLQFDKSFRPAYYGTWHKKSDVVGPRHPLKKDPKLDYEVESDEEWEEEDPGESLSDCEKDNEDCLEEEDLKNKEADDTDDTDDTDDNVDSFVVPDGYLSENEGIQNEISSNPIEDGAKCSPCSDSEIISEELRALLQHQRFLNKLTEKALRKNQPLVISNLNLEKTELLATEDLAGTVTIEQQCLQALCMRKCSGGSAIDLPTNSGLEYEHQEISQSTKESNAQMTPGSSISDSDLSEFVRAIQSCPCGINKVVEVLQQKFPTISKVALRKKVKEMSIFEDNHWQVKKDVLDKLGLHNSPGKGSSQKGISSYFSKRCLPYAAASINMIETSPEKCSKSKEDCSSTDKQYPSVYSSAV